MLQDNLRNNTLISNIAGNLVRAGQHRPMISGPAAVLKAQEMNLHNNLMQTQDTRLKATMAKEVAKASLKEKQILGVNSVLNNVGVGKLTAQEAIPILQQQYGNPEGDGVGDKAAKDLAGGIARERAVADQKLQVEAAAREATKFGERNDPPPPGTYAPSNLKKLADELDALNALKAKGQPVDDKLILAYEAEISKSVVNMPDMSPEEIDVWGKLMALTGKMPSLGRGKDSTKVRLAIAKSAARQAMGADADGIPDEEGKTPVAAAFSMLQQTTDTKAIQTSLNFLDKQTSAMGSFVENIGLQVDKVGELAEDLKTFDARIMNVPLRMVRGKIAGSALQAKYDMYLTEIESEIGKLATGSVASIAELSATAQEKWGKIHDKNLSITDMLSLLEETENAAGMRYQSVKNQLTRTRKRMVNRTAPGLDVAEPGAFPVEIKSDADYNSLPSGAEFIAPDGSRRRKP